MRWIKPLLFSLALAFPVAGAAAQYAFKPYAGSTNTITATTTNVATAITLPSVPGRRAQVRLYNAGAATVFVLFGTSGVVATTANMPIPTGTIEVYSLPDGATHVGTITATGTATLYMTTGEGV